MDAEGVEVGGVAGVFEVGVGRGSGGVGRGAEVLEADEEGCCCVCWGVLAVKGEEGGRRTSGYG